ncbi:ferritin-like domain-containing protein [Fluviicola chungangensis]|uniref:PA2169 family four-helix-bundle protein n=1 Tax=Fluviicola chungangensis TaxID=2597671 RepID=A0A556MQH9_9FLAO|nr:PA2169 family four-helix-bundle protein [Fluviicola chungangensis]TSJ42082.1 PA2169 family four-helix-bundle protein [Fluviicola chungangensis]
MATNNQEIVDCLNNLVQINNDRIQGYLTASQETDQDDLRSVFSEMMTTSQECRRELVHEITKLGGTPVEGTTVSGKLYRIWMDIKSALTSKDRKAILNSCEFGEDAAVKTYQTEIDSDALNGTEYLLIVKEQYSKIKSGHDKIKQLRDAANNAA